MTISKVHVHHQRSPLTPQEHLAKRSSPGQGKSFATLLGQPGLAAVPTSSNLVGWPLPVADPKALSTVSPDHTGLVQLGKIDLENPTVSHLLTGHTQYQRAGWDIIAAKVNQDKPFTNIKPGTVVYLNPGSQELVWAAGQKPLSPLDGPRPSGQGLEGGQIDQAQAEAKTAASPMVIGTIDAEHPTLSHLLKSSPPYSDNAWEIIFSAGNQDKPYASLRPGCLVSIDPQTLELSFAQNDSAPAPPPSSALAAIPNPPPSCSVGLPDEPGQRQFAERLAASVKAYLGQPYHKIDCYALVVQGLKDQGVQYSGTDGLRNSLKQMAVSQGLPSNAYQNGEGLIEVAGQKLYGQSFGRINDVERQAAMVMEQLQPLLQEGMLLSFSTPSRGHTGVIAKQDGQWTYVNSGVIDHQVDGEMISKRVGEERLAAEIRNWFVLAKNKRTSLQISGGGFDPQKLKVVGRMMATNQVEGHGSASGTGGNDG